MPYQTWIADNCRRFGLTVEEYSGWTTRGNPSFNPGGVLAHWTAGPCRATGRPSLNVVVNGRSGLPGPLCNVYHDRNGICVIVAAGRANHAGDGGYRGLAGNSSVLGVESEQCNAGDRTQAQWDTYPVLLAALAAGIGRDASWVARHCDWTTRKIDINDWPLPDLQAQTATALATGGGPQPEDEVIDMRGFLVDVGGTIWYVAPDFQSRVGCTSQAMLDAFVSAGAIRTQAIAADAVRAVPVVFPR